MADNQYSRRHASRIEDLPENDPLAELARIVGFEPEPQDNEGVARPAAHVEPAIDLEEELLREFEAFDVSSRHGGRSGAAPHLEPANQPQPLAGRPAAAPEPDFASDDRHEAWLEDELLRDIEGRGTEPEGEAAEPVFDVPADDPAQSGYRARYRDWQAPDVNPEPLSWHDDRNAAAGSDERAQPAFDDLAVEELFAAEPGADSQARDERTAEPLNDDKFGAADAFHAIEQDRHADESGEPDFDFSFDEADGFADEAEVARAAALDERWNGQHSEADGADEPALEDDAPFISLNHHDLDRIDAAAGEHIVDAAALEEDLAAELRLSGLEPELDGETKALAEEGAFHPRTLFAPASEDWPQAAARSEAFAEPATADDGAAEVGGFDPASLEENAASPFDEAFSFDETFEEPARDEEPAASDGQAFAAFPAAPYAQPSSDDILADITRFEISASGEDQRRPEAIEASTNAFEAPAEAAPEAEPESGLDAWLREMGLEQPVRGHGEVAAESAAAWAQADNIVPLHGPTSEAEPEWPEEVEAAAPETDEWQRTEPETPAAPEPDDIDGLHAALEADLAAVYEEMMSEPEVDRERPEGDAAGHPAGADRAADEVPDEPAPRGAAEPYPFRVQPRSAEAPPRRVEARDASPVQLAPARENSARIVEDEPAGERRLVAPEAVAAGFEAFEFDPASLSDTEEPVELAPELEIPHVPAEDEPPTSVAAADDFDLDLESDFEALLGETKNEATEQAASEPVAEGAVAAAAAAAAFGGAAHEAYGAAQWNASAGAAPAARAPILEGEGEEGFGENFDIDLSRPGEAGAPRDVSAFDAPPAPASRFTSRRSMRLGAGVAAAVLVLGAGAVVWHGLGSSDKAGSDGPRIIAADTKPVKQKPASPGGKQVPNQNKIVYDSVDGTINRTPQQKNLVTSAEQPADVVQRTLDPDVLPLGSPERVKANQATRQTPAGDSGKGQDRLAADATAPASPEAAALSGLEPRQVETMVVTADGKLVPRDGGKAPAATPAAAGSADTHSAGSAAETAAAGPTAPASGVAAAPLAPPSASAEPVHAPVPTIRPEQQAAAAPVAPAPAAPANPPAAQGPAPQASEPPPAATAAATPQQAAPANPGGYFIQIASQPTEAGAKASYQNLSRRYSSVIGGHGVDIQRAEITGKGVYYRVRVAAGSREQAISLCESYKSAGGSCFVTH